jgi:NAD-dependent deacetylase
MAELPAPEAIANALRGSATTVVLTGLFLGNEERRDLTHGRQEWAQRASLEAFLTEPQRFWEYYYPAAQRIAERQPTAAHSALARLQAAGHLTALITQAVDRVHARAGSVDVIEVYGSVLVHRCQRCNERYGLPELGGLIEGSSDGIPRCDAPECDYPLRPEGTHWGEPLHEAAVKRAWELAAEADLMIVIDSDLQTAPISLLPSVPLTKGSDLIIIGSEPTQYDRYARLVVREASTDIVGGVETALQGAT